MNLIWTPKDRYILKPLKPFSRNLSHRKKVELKKINKLKLEIFNEYFN